MSLKSGILPPKAVELATMQTVMRFPYSPDSEVAPDGPVANQDTNERQTAGQNKIARR